MSCFIRSPDIRASSCRFPPNSWYITSPFFPFLALGSPYPPLIFPRLISIIMIGGFQARFFSYLAFGVEMVPPQRSISNFSTFFFCSSSLSLSDYESLLAVLLNFPLLTEDSFWRSRPDYFGTSFFSFRFLACNFNRLFLCLELPPFVAILTSSD